MQHSRIFRLQSMFGPNAISHLVVLEHVGALSTSRLPAIARISKRRTAFSTRVTMDGTSYRALARRTFTPASSRTLDSTFLAGPSTWVVGSPLTFRLFESRMAVFGNLPGVSFPGIGGVFILP